MFFVLVVCPAFVYIDKIRAKNKIKSGFYERKQLTINTESYTENKNLKEILNLRFNLNFEEYEKIKSYSIPSKILPDDNFTEMLENFCYVYRINVDRNQICFIYEKELNQITAKKIKRWDTKQI